MNMSVIDKIIKKLLLDESVTYKDAEKLLLYLGFELQVTGSHHIFRKKGYARNVSIKKRKILLSYQIKMIKEVLKDHGY